MTTPDGRDEHRRFEQAFTECPVMWVAIDRRTGDVRAAASTPDELAERIKRERISGVEVLCAPAAGEPEVVGFG